MKKPSENSSSEVDALQPQLNELLHRYSRTNNTCRMNATAKKSTRQPPKTSKPSFHASKRKRRALPKKYPHSIRYYYEYTGNNEMRNLAARLRKQRITQKPFPLRDFLKINPAHIEELEALNIRNAAQMLEAGKISRKRQELSAKTGIPPEAIPELVKLSDLTQIFGVKSIRARLYYDAGIDTLEEMAKWNPHKLRTMLINLVQKTGFDSTASLPKEAEFTIKEAKK